MKIRWSRFTSALGVCVLLLSLAACGGNGLTEGEWKAADDRGQQEASDAFFYAVNKSATGGTLFDSAAEMEAVKEKPASGSRVYGDSAVKLIRRANLTVQTTQFDQAVAALEELVIGMDGYYEHAEVRGGSYYDRQSNRSASYTIRIPAKEYDAFLQQAGGIGYLARKNESSEDIGEVYHDVESRLKTQRTKQERLLGLLEKAGSMEDIIALENALTEVEYQIEQYTTDLNRYDSLVGYATIHLTLEEMIRIVDEPGEKAGLLARMKAGVISSAEGIASGIEHAVVWFAYNLFGLVFLAAVLVTGYLLGRRHIRRRKAEKQEKSEQDNG